MVAAALGRGASPDGGVGEACVGLWGALRTTVWSRTGSGGSRRRGAGRPRRRCADGVIRRLLRGGSSVFVICATSVVPPVETFSWSRASFRGPAGREVLRGPAGRDVFRAPVGRDGAAASAAARSTRARNRSRGFRGAVGRFVNDSDTAAVQRVDDVVEPAPQSVHLFLGEPLSQLRLRKARRQLAEAFGECAGDRWRHVALPALHLVWGYAGKAPRRGRHAGILIDEHRARPVIILPPDHHVPFVAILIRDEVVERVDVVAEARFPEPVEICLPGL